MEDGRGVHGKRANAKERKAEDVETVEGGSCEAQKNTPNVQSPTCLRSSIDEAKPEQALPAAKPECSSDSSAYRKTYEVMKLQ